MYSVSKRDGAVVDFDISKISTAIRKAFDASQTQYNDDIIDFIAPDTRINNIQLGVPVSINIENGVAAMALAHLNGVTDEEIRQGMASFRGRQPVAMTTARALPFVRIARSRMTAASARVMGSLGRSTLLPLPSGLPCTTPDARAAAEAALAQSGV